MFIPLQARTTAVACSSAMTTVHPAPLFAVPTNQLWIGINSGGTRERALCAYVGDMVPERAASAAADQSSRWRGGARGDAAE